MTSPAAHWRFKSTNYRPELALHLATKTSAGVGLTHLDQPVLAETQDSLLIMLSVSGGIRHADPGSVLSDAIARLRSLARDSNRSDDGQLAHVQAGLEALFNEGAFFEGVPNGALVQVSESGIIRARVFGPVGLAVVADGAVTLLHEDTRLPALREKGIDVSSVFPKSAFEDRLTQEVTALTDLGANGAVEAGRLSPDAGLMILSRGAFPFCPPQKATPINEWWNLDAGHRHGMSGVVSVICNRDTDPMKWLPQLASSS